MAHIFISLSMLMVLVMVNRLNAKKLVTRIFFHSLLDFSRSPVHLSLLPSNRELLIIEEIMSALGVNVHKFEFT